MIATCTLTFDIKCWPRFGCASGKHRAWVVGELTADWLNRTLCPTIHCPLGRERSWHLQKTVVDERHPLHNLNPGVMLEQCISWVRQAGAAVLFLVIAMTRRCDNDSALALTCKTLLQCAAKLSPGPRRWETRSENICPVYQSLPDRYYGFLPANVQTESTVGISDTFR